MNSPDTHTPPSTQSIYGHLQLTKSAKFTETQSEFVQLVLNKNLCPNLETNFHFPGEVTTFREIVIFSTLEGGE